MLSSIETLFDSIEALWFHERTERFFATILIVMFVGLLTLVQFKLWGMLNSPVFSVIPDTHFAAISAVFTLLLGWEVIGLVFSLAQSVTRALGKQIEILSLILLRQSFKEIGHLPEPFIWAEAFHTILYVLADSIGALIIFTLLAFFYRALKRNPVKDVCDEHRSYIQMKKFLSLLLLVLFGLIAVLTFHHDPFFSDSHLFFTHFYTVLIFSDVLIVLFSLRYSSTYHVVFRNSGYAVTTIMLRLSLASPPYFNVALGIAATLYTIGLTMAYSQYTRDPSTTDTA